MKIADVKKTATLVLASLLLAGVGLRTAEAAQPVLVELFTSEGRSSCPPADALLRHLVASQPIAGVQIVALEEHMDYWNSLGWRGPFSVARFTRRHRQYAAANRGGSAYTPQMVVNGRVGFVGSDSAHARETIVAAGNAQLATISLSRTYLHTNRLDLQIKMKQLPADRADKVVNVWLAVTEDDLAGHVTAGENDGRRLVHDVVVRHLDRTGRISLNAEDGYSADPTVTLSPAWHRNNLHAVVFVQGATSRHILGLASLALKPTTITKSN